MSEPTDVKPEREREADSVIKKHMVFAMAGGAIPIPLLDLTAVTAVQLDMLKQLSKVYDVRFDGRSARTFVTSLTMALAGTTAARLGASLLKLLPGVGSLAGGVAQVGFTGASTYALGTLFKRLFREGRSVEEIKVAEVKDELADYFEAGKKVAAEVSEQVKSGAGKIKAKVGGKGKRARRQRDE